MDADVIGSIGMNGNPNWTDVTQALGAIAAVLVGILGFLFVWFQIRSLKQALYSDTQSKLYAADFEIHKLILEAPRLRPYFYDNVEVQSDSPDKAAIESVAEIWCTHLEHIMLQLENLPEFIRQSWVDYARHMYNTSPAVRDRYEVMRTHGLYASKMDLMLRRRPVEPASNKPHPIAIAFPASQNSPDKRSPPSQLGQPN